MAIYKRPRTHGGFTYQVKIKHPAGWTTGTFPTRAEAIAFEAQTRVRIKNGDQGLGNSSKMTLIEYFALWDRELKTLKRSEGWRKTQLQMFRDYVEPVIGHIEIAKVTPAHVQRVLTQAMEDGRGPQTLVHVFTLMRKLFNDAKDLFRIVTANPVLKSLKPGLPEKESRYLTVDEATRLLNHVEGKEFELAIWLGFVCGLRVGEIQALKWEHVDFDRGLLHVRATYVRREGCFKDYPKGKRWHSVPIQRELLHKLAVAHREQAGEFVVRSPDSEFLNYGWYLRTLKRYCREAGLPDIATHALRHSVSGLLMAHGASSHDLQAFFAHSSLAVTERYIHGKGSKLEAIANNIVMFPKRAEEASVSQKFPKPPASIVDSG